MVIHDRVQHYSLFGLSNTRGQAVQLTDAPVQICGRIPIQSFKTVTASNLFDEKTRRRACLVIPPIAPPGPCANQ